MSKTYLELEGESYFLYLEGNHHHPLVERSWFDGLLNQPGWQGFGRITHHSEGHSFLFPFITTGGVDLRSREQFLVPAPFDELWPGPRSRSAVLQDIIKDPARLIDYLAIQIDTHVREWGHEQDIKKVAPHRRLLPKAYAFGPLSREAIQQGLYGFNALKS